MVLGSMSLIYGFLSAPSTISEAQEMVADIQHGEEHGTSLNHYKEESSETDIDKQEVDHGEHLLHQLQNRPWAALYVAALFFFMIPLGVLAFYAINRASQAGWSIVLFRVMEGITGYLLPGSITIFIILVLSVMHLNHLFQAVCFLYSFLIVFVKIKLTESLIVNQHLSFEFFFLQF